MNTEAAAPIRQSIAPVTTTQFVAGVLGLLPFEPPRARRGERFGTSEHCWLCGGTAGGASWPQPIAIAPTFTQHNTARCPDSDAVCQACAALTRAETFQALVRARQLPLKTWTQCGWHSYSHYIRDTGAYESPVPTRVRKILLDPPSGRWLLCINTTGKKHTIFRATVATSRASFPVQVDEETIWTTLTDVRGCMADFERLTALGFRKEAVQTGRYDMAYLMRAGLDRWRPAEDAMQPWRDNHPGLVALARYAARSARFFAPKPGAAPAPQEDAPA